MFKVSRKSIEQVKRFFGCSSLDAVYYLMPDNLIAEGRVTDFTVVDGALPALAVEADYRARIAGYDQSALMEG